MLLLAATGYFALALASAIVYVTEPQWPISAWFLLAPLVASLLAGTVLKRWIAVLMAGLIPVAFGITEALWSAGLIESPDSYFNDGLFLLALSPFVAVMAAALIALGIVVRLVVAGRRRPQHAEPGS